MKWQIFGNSDAGGLSWDENLIQLSGASVFQTHSWSKYKKNMGWDSLKLAAKDSNGSTKAMIQVLYQRRIGSLVLAWAPGGMAGDLELCDHDLRERICKTLGSHKTYLRVGFLHTSHGEKMRTLIAKGWSPSSHRMNAKISMTLNLKNDESQLLKAMTSNWRHNLKRGQKNSLSVVRWENPSVDEVLKIYSSMETFKGLGQQHSADSLSAIFSDLKENIILLKCLDDGGRVIALRGCIVFGKCAWDSFAAVDELGRKKYASYLCLWTLLQECRKRGIESYDLMGVDPVRNPGVYSFKKGTGAEEIDYLGEWEWSSVPLLKPLINLVLKVKGGVI